MAITNAQQYQQLVNKPANGKRPGYRGDPRDFGFNPAQAAANVGKASTASTGRRDPRDVGFDPREAQISKQYGDGITPTGDDGRIIPKDTTPKAPPKKPKKTKKNTLPTLNAAEKFRVFNLKKLYDKKMGLTPNIYGIVPNLLQSFTPNKLQFYEESDPMFDATYYGMSGEEITDADRLAAAINEAEKTGNITQKQFESAFFGPDGPPQTVDRDEPQPLDPCKGPNPPAYCFIGEKAEETMKAAVTRNLGGATARIGGSLFNFDGPQFAADGGRIGAQEGGIMSRLSQLSGSVSSAEQMLQQINQRLESAESSLGSGGGGFGSGGPLDQGMGPDKIAEAKVVQANQSPSTMTAADKIHPDFRTGQPTAQLFGSNKTPSLAELYPNAGQQQVDDFIPMRGGAEMMQAAGFGIPAAGYAEGGRIGLKSGSDLLAEQALQQAGNIIFPEGNLQNIKATSPDQKTYNIEATKDMVENLPGGLLKDIAAPAAALVTSPFYDAGQAFDRMKPGSGITGFAKALDAENPLSSAVERFIGASAPLAERFNNLNIGSAKADEVDPDIKVMLAKEAQLKKQKQQAKNFKKIKEAQLAKEAAAAMEAAQRAATKRQAAQNQASGTGGFQSNFAQDKDFMSGSGTAAEMGSFAKGGIASLDREAFLLGGIAKGLKKAVRGLKKVAKSPIGKAALLGIGGGFMGIGPFKGLATAKGLGFKNFMLNKVLGTPLGDITGTRTGGLLGLIKDNPMTSIFLTSALAGAMTPKEDQGNDALAAYYAQNTLNPNAPLNKRILGTDFYGGQLAADGGRIGYQEGGDAEPVAKKTMPLIDMDGKEKDYRETGGFVDMGRMERADDVPARLSKNEFVFTADAVRNAGEGDIDKGAEVMYNMMKNLEAGGEVSEESQGLEGAREMFQTSQRLGEVI